MIVSYGIFRVNLFFSFRTVIFFIFDILIDLNLKLLIFTDSSAMLYSVWYIRMHEVSAMKMKQAMKGIRLSALFVDNSTNTRHKTIVVTEYIIEIHTQLFAFSDIRELKVLILLCLIYV